MIEQHWQRLFALLDGGWPGELSEQEADALRVLLDGVDPERIATGVRRLLHNGARFRPSAAEILAAAKHDPSRPTFEEAVVLVRRAFRARPPRPWTWPDAMEKARAERMAVIDALRSGHPLVASFADRFGLDRLAALPLDDEDEGKWRLKELRDAWDTHVEAMDGREVAALAAGTGREGLRQLDPLERLGINRPAPGLPSGRTEAA